MKLRIFIAAAIAMVVVSCKKDQDVEKTDATKVEQKENFSVEMDVIAEKDDDFAVYYTEDGSINFNPEHVIWHGVKGHGVKGQPVSQKVIFDFPEDVIPKNLRFDFGIKKKADQGNVILEKFKISYYGKDFEAKGSDFLKYFIKNDSIDAVIDETKGTIKFNQNLKNSVTPFYYPNRPIVDEIEKIIK